MKLNHECIRNILLYVEEHSRLGKELNEKDISDSICSVNNYNREEVQYHLNQLALDRYITDFTYHNSATYINEHYYSVNDLTPKGHKYLGDIRNKKIWDKLKDNDISGMSIDILKEVAKELSLTFLKKKVGIE